MEAQKLQKKKRISKDKIKKTLKNVICRPDPTYWPVILETEENIIKSALKKHCVQIPVFKKPHWKDIKSIPKKERPKPAQIQRVEGLIFGISECCDALKKINCAAVLIEANVNPQAIVQPVINACTSSNISVLCIKDLRQFSLTNFGIKTTCLGVKKNCLQDLYNEIQEIYQNYKYVKNPEPTPVLSSNNDSFTDNIKKEGSDMDLDYCPYIYRTDKKNRAFVPENTQHYTKGTGQFIGENYIQISEESDLPTQNKVFMGMILKRISNNADRA